MPIKFDLEQLRSDHNCTNYFETGLWDPRDPVSSKQALAAGFSKVYCIEIREDWVNLGKDIFSGDIAKGRYHLILDDSINMKQYLQDDVFNNKTMFFLDAHVDHPDIHNFRTRCPLFYELDAIKSLPRKDNVILVDDLRILTQPFPWMETNYGNINFLDEIKQAILTINKDYKFTTLNGHIENDVLLAYV